MSERFWSQPSVEPKRSFRYYFTLSGQEEQLETYAIKTVKKPSYTISEVPHQFVAHTFYYPGRVTWNPVEITFVDPVVPDQSAAITNMFVRSGYRVPKTEAISLSSFSKENAVVAVGTPIITQIDADGKPIEEWSLNNCFLTNVDYGQLDYSSEELVINSLTLRYDFATYEVFNSNATSLLTP